MKYPRYVQVSPDAPDSWWDPKSGKWFKKEDQVITLEDGLDAANIVRYLRFNYLIDVTSLVKPEVKIAEKVQTFVEQTPAQLLHEDPVTEPESEALTEAAEKKDNTCPYCGKEYAPKGLPNHIKSCKQNPDNK